ncbi:MAG: peroxiredoxin [bacterium]
MAPPPRAPGAPPPHFTRNTHAGDPFTLSAHRGRWVVLFFYPRDFTPGCTAQSCAFRDGFAELSRLHAVILGVSGDSDHSHRAFATKHALPYPLISDADGSLRKLFTVPRSLLGLLPGRATYVIDPAGVVRMVFISQLRAREHAERAVHVIQQASV